MKLQHKIFLSYLLFISTFSLMFLISIYSFFRNQSRKELIFSAEKTYSQASDLLDYQLRQFIHASYIVDTSEEISAAANLPQDKIISSPGKQALTQTQITGVINRSLLPLTNANMRIYVDDTFHYIIGHRQIGSLSVLKQNDWYEDFLSQGTLTTWQLTLQSDYVTTEEIPSLSLFRKIDTTSPRGWISELYITQTDLQRILTTASPIDGGIVFLQSQNGDLLSCTDQEFSQLVLDASDDFFKKGEINWEHTTIQNRKYLIYSRHVTSTNWYLTLLLPLDTTSISLTGLLLYLVIVFIVILIFSILGAYFFTRTFTRRLLLLETKMTTLCAGDLDTRIAEKGTDEISHLFQCFNYMASKMKHLMEQQYENGIRVKTAEYNALQAQINPHFLYNTLELIKWKAMENDAPEIVQLSYDLAKFYQLSLSNGHSMIPLQSELDLILRYLEIQNFRFSQEIQIVSDIPKECLPLLIPKLTLQPLIENTIMHGFISNEDTETSPKIISISAQQTDTDLLITVSDNGIGMTLEQLERIFTEKPFHIEHGFGVYSVQQRLQLLYGQNYGLTYQSAPGEGVSVLIRLKLQTSTHT